jgi:C4-dicarboxylate-specific signal transduction histidine kinase
MNPGMKFRVIALGVAMIVMGGLIALVTMRSQQQASQLQARLNQLDSESSDILEQFRETYREENDKLLRYQLEPSGTNWNEFMNTGQQLERWVFVQKDKLSTQPEKRAVQQIKTAHDAYLQEIKSMHAALLASGQTNTLSLAQWDSLTPARRRLFDAGQGLAESHSDQRTGLLAQARDTLIKLRESVFGLLGLVFLCGITLAIMVYKDMITPLRVKLVESEALAERHEKLASLGLLAAGVAHEIRNPLTAVKAALFIQKKKIPPGSPERENVDVVEREILRLERIVNDFLQFARPAEPKFTVISADLLLLESRTFFVTQLKKQNIQVVIEPADPLWVRVDPAQCRQVLTNLIQNAADSIGQNGKITLRARSDRRQLGNAEVPVVIMEVADTGKGIPPDVEKRLFDPFFTTKENGTGLGLSIAARIVQKHGGELQYQTQVNRGTIFGIILPQLVE